MPLLGLRLLPGMMVAAETVPRDLVMRGGAALGDRPLSVDAVMLGMANVDADMAAVAARDGALRLPVAMLYGCDDQVAVLRRTASVSAR